MQEGLARISGPEMNRYVPITQRDPVTDHVTFTFVGGGVS